MKRVGNNKCLRCPLIYTGLPICCPSVPKEGEVLAPYNFRKEKEILKKQFDNVILERECIQKDMAKMKELFVFVQNMVEKHGTPTFLIENSNYYKNH